MNVLVADDDPSLRLALRLVLEDAGHDVVEANTVGEARTVIAAGSADLLLLDAGMSGSGTRLWLELDDHPRYRGRALLLTGDVPTLRDLGRHERVIEKPFDYGLLLERIDEAGPLR